MLVSGGGLDGNAYLFVQPAAAKIVPAIISKDYAIRTFIGTVTGTMTTTDALMQLTAVDLAYLRRQIS